LAATPGFCFPEPVWTGLRLFQGLVWLVFSFSAAAAFFWFGFLPEREIPL
jgi:hypothetical protein